MVGCEFGVVVYVGLEVGFFGGCGGWVVVVVLCFWWFYWVDWVIVYVGCCDVDEELVVEVVVL